MIVLPPIPDCVPPGSPSAASYGELLKENAELHAALRNERGDGWGPSEKWAWNKELEIWEWMSPEGHSTYDVRWGRPGRWYWRHSFPPYDRGVQPTARDAMRAADRARDAANGS